MSCNADTLDNYKILVSILQENTKMAISILSVCTSKFANMLAILGQL